MERQAKKAARTRSKLPKLKVAIMRGNKRVKFVELDDPRERYCLTFNSLGSENRAVPA
jgi:hypothetical protein